MGWISFLFDEFSFGASITMKMKWWGSKKEDDAKELLIPCDRVTEHLNIKMEPMNTVVEPMERITYGAYNLWTYRSCKLLQLSYVYIY